MSRKTSSFELEVDPEGNIHAIYSDDLTELMEHGDARITRASHVEPADGGWVADLSPVSGPKLGPFQLRQQALDAEVEWLRARMFGGDDARA